MPTVDKNDRLIKSQAVESTIANQGCSLRTWNDRSDVLPKEAIYPLTIGYQTLDLLKTKSIGQIVKFPPCMMISADF
jgi:hypothetical protein